MTVGPLFLGFDLSTQQLKAAIIDKHGSFVCENSVHFDRELPSYGTTNGALRGDLPGEVYCPVIVWIEALDLLMNKMKGSKVAFSEIVAISGAAQVHISFVRYASKRERLTCEILSNMVRCIGVVLPFPFYSPWTPASLWHANSYLRHSPPSNVQYGRTPLQQKNAGYWKTRWVGHSASQTLQAVEYTRGLRHHKFSRLESSSRSPTKLLNYATLVTQEPSKCLRCHRAHLLDFVLLNISICLSNRTHRGFGRQRHEPDEFRNAQMGPISFGGMRWSIPLP